MNAFIVTNDYMTLIHKAYELASICEYDTQFDIKNGVLFFINSPLFTAFTLIVDPISFRDDPATILMLAFEKRNECKP